MNKFIYCFFVTGLLFLGACKKDNNYMANGTATLNVINGIIKKDVLVKMNGSINNSGANSINGAQKFVSFLTNNFYYGEAKNTSIDFLNRTDSVSLTSKNVDLKKGGIYTVLLAGIAPNAETVVIDDSDMPFENLSKTPTDADSIINLRFINLSPDVQPIDVRMVGTSTNEATGIAFKGYSPFKAYQAKFVNGQFYSQMNFQFIENGVVIKTYTYFVYYPNRFKNVAFALMGMKTPGPGQQGLVVIPVNYFQ